MRRAIDVTLSRKLLCGASLFLFLALPSSTQVEKSTPPAGRSQDFSLSLNVNLVVLHVSVADRSGGFLTALSQENFHVYEEGQPQPIKLFLREDVPVTAGLVVDNSGSMIPKRPEVIAAFLAFARSSNPQDEMFVVNFNDRVSLGLPPSLPFTSDAGKLRAALSSEAPGGMTKLYDSLALALEHLRRGKADKKVLVLVSDGGDNASQRRFAEVLDMADRSGAIIYTIGLFDESDRDSNPSVLGKLARATGGQAFRPQSITEVVGICRRIAGDIRNQYTLEYVPPPNQKEGDYRKVLVRVVAPGHKHLVVRTRSGYFTPSSKTKLAAEQEGRATP